MSKEKIKEEFERVVPKEIYQRDRTIKLMCYARDLTAKTILEEVEHNAKYLNNMKILAIDVRDFERIKKQFGVK